jgi:hypothetical protein
MDGLIMTNEKAKMLASVLGGEVVAAMPQSRSPGVRLTLADGRVALLDELGGATYRGAASVAAYAVGGDDDAHVEAVAEWPHWGVTEEWTQPLANLLGGEAYQSGGNIWVVLFERPDGRFVVIGDDGADIYQSADLYERYYEAGQPGPEFVYWTASAAKP